MDGWTALLATACYSCTYVHIMLCKQGAICSVSHRHLLLVVKHQLLISLHIAAMLIKILKTK